MTKHEKLINKANECTKKAAGTNDLNLKLFYRNASEGFKIKAEKLTVEEAEEVVK